MDRERREHRRLDINLPLECHDPVRADAPAFRAVTRNISTGGLQFEADLVNGHEPPPVQSLLTVNLTIPPGEGHFPYEGRVTSLAEVVRCDVLNHAIGEQSSRRIAVAARFREPLKLIF